ncbi:hypothetical protein BKA80DRAFT_302300 [Phyllosticta citrichinensis]
MHGGGKAAGEFSRRPLTPHNVAFRVMFKTHHHMRSRDRQQHSAPSSPAANFSRSRRTEDKDHDSRPRLSQGLELQPCVLPMERHTPQRTPPPFTNNIMSTQASIHAPPYPPSHSRTKKLVH